MSFAQVLSPKSSSHTSVRSSISAHISYVAALCSPIFAAVFALIDDIATRIPPSYCPLCRIRNPQGCHLRTAANPTPITNSSVESEKTALVFDSSTERLTLKKLEDIDVEKAIYRSFLPSSAESLKVEVPGESKTLAQVRDEERRKRGPKHQPSLIEGFFIIPSSAGSRKTTPSTEGPQHEDAQPVELPATPASPKRKQEQKEEQQQQESPVELPAEEISPVTPRAVLAGSPPRLRTPRPRSQNSRKVSPLLAPPPVFGTVETLRTSCGSSVGSESIQIAYVPSHEGVA